MELVGQILKKNREIKKLKLSEVSSELKISQDILYNIENGFENKEINNVFLIGHLRSYCSFLNLNDNSLIDQFKKENFPAQAIKIEIRKPNVEKKLIFSNKFFSLSLIIIVFVSFYILFIETDKKTKEYAIIPDLPENYIATIEEANLNNFKYSKTNNLKDDVLKSNQNINSSSAIASTPGIKEINYTSVTLKFLNDTWVQIRDKNDEIILSQLMEKNEEYSYELESQYSITSGNAGHILVLIDKKVRGRIGKMGQVVDSLVLDKDFNN